MRHGFRLALWVSVLYVPFFVLCATGAVLVDRGIVPEDNVPVLLSIPVAGMVAAIFAIVYAAKRQLRKKFLSREVVTFERWFQTYYPEGDVSPEVAGAVIELVAKGIGGGVQPVQVRPSDRLDEDFTSYLCGTAIDRGGFTSDPLEYLDDELGEWFQHHTGRELEPKAAGTTLDDLIREVSDQFARE
jgi:hypothetical protein